MQRSESDHRRRHIVDVVSLPPPTQLYSLHRTTAISNPGDRDTMDARMPCRLLIVQPCRVRLLTHHSDVGLRLVRPGRTLPLGHWRRDAREEMVLKAEDLFRQIESAGSRSTPPRRSGTKNIGVGL